MTETQKKLAIIGGVILVALLLLFRKGGNVVNRLGDNVTNEFDAPGGVTIGARGPLAIPGITINNPLPELSAISACCSDCSGSAPRASYAPAVPGNTYVYNAANRGPNVFNYFSNLFAPTKPQVIAYNY
jgi:hypothetical protein